MQVFSACCDSFAHGANDVANAMVGWCRLTQDYSRFTPG